MAKATLELTTLDPKDFPDQAAVRRFVLSDTFKALSVGVREVLSHEDEEITELLAERAREAGYFVEMDLCALARAAAESAEAGTTPFAGAAPGEGWGQDTIEYLDALYLLMISNNTNPDYTKPVLDLKDRYERKLRRAVIDAANRKETTKAEPAGVA